MEISLLIFYVLCADIFQISLVYSLCTLCSKLDYSEQYSFDKWIIYVDSWETGAPSAGARAARTARYANARTQMTSAFPPQKRLTLERKSPVTRLDINAPNFTAYKKTYPGLFREE